MKTHVISLAPYDDVTSIRDRLDWAQAGRILLVFPPDARILSRTLDLRLLRLHAARLGAQLALVARSGDLRSLAQEAGLPVFKSVTGAQQAVWKKEPPAGKSPEKIGKKSVRSLPRADLRRMRPVTLPSEMDWRSRPDLRLVVFALAALAVLALLLFSVSSALAPAAAVP